jgi:hypothetical protein
MKRAAIVSAALVGATAIVALLPDADAQRIDPRRPAAFVVGAPPGASPMLRVDARRTGLSKTPLPAGTLRIAWRKSTGLTLDQPALSGADGSLAVVSARGDVSFLDQDGEERATVKVGAAQVGPAAMTSDGTVVYATSAGDVIGIRRSSTQPRFSTRIGGERNVRAAPLALADGGVILATLTDLVVLDSEGNVRARVTLPETPSAALIAAGDKVISVTSTGAVFSWAPGREAVRIGSFGAPIDGGAVLANNGVLLAVIEGNHLAEVDIAHGGRSTRSIAAQGLYLGPPAIRPLPAGGGTATSMLALTQTRGFVLTLDPSGQELLRAPIASFTPVPLADGGAPPLVAPGHVGPIVDERGAIAFAATDGHVGMVAPEGSVDTLGEILCSKGIRSGVVGLTPFGKGAFAVTCDGGVVLKITGTNAEPLRPPSASPPASGSPDKLRPSPRD